MLSSTPILQTKLSPPAVTVRTLERQRVITELKGALNYRLTILQARAGYGKSTALATLAAVQKPAIWYQVGVDDNDLSIFLLHLCHAARLGVPGIRGLPIGTLESWEATLDPFPMQAVIYQFLNALSEIPEPVLLVLDDAHLVLDNSAIAHAVDQIIGLAPPNLHVLLSSRLQISLPSLADWRLRGEVLTFDRSFLLFNREEIAALFERHYEYELTEEETGVLYTATEGWAITLQLIWQNLRSGGLRSVSEDLSRQDKPLESLFEMLAHDVLGNQPEDVQRFLVATAVLRELTPGACDAVLRTSGSSAMLAYLRRQEFFIVDLDGADDDQLHLRYHFIFHRFLRRQSDPEDGRRWHLRAAAYFSEQGDQAAAIYHHLKAEDYEASARLLVDYGARLLSSGRLDSLAAALDSLPPRTLSQHPDLVYFLGDLARLHSRFEEAIGWYQQAEKIWRETGRIGGISRALRGQARVYLDTLNPSRAEELLQESLRLSDGTADREAQARLLELLAENKLNTGKPMDAERLRAQAADLRLEGPSDQQLLYRVLLRTGRLFEAIRKLEEQAEIERDTPVQPPRGHRETPLLLSILYAFRGDCEAALRTAQEGAERGLALNSPFITAVGHMRKGHALMLLGRERYPEAIASFEKTKELSRKLAVPRLLVETYWGLCRAHGYGGDLPLAQKLAENAIEMAGQYGDEWVTALTRLSMGNSFLLAARYETAEEWLNRARRGFEECSDSFGAAVAQLMLCLNLYRQGDTERLEGTLPGVLSTCSERGFDFLFTRPTLLAVPDERMLTPLLVHARDRGWEPRYVETILRKLGIPDVSLHPGYRLNVVTLGAFETARGDETIPGNGWIRTAARQLWQLLLTHFDAPLDREQIFEHLWPEMEPDAAGRNFKVALNTLYKVLEPDRPPGVESAYILREGSVYGFRPGADMDLDLQRFIDLVRQALEPSSEGPQPAIKRLEEAVGLYRGDYLPDARYETWVAGRREQLAVLFLQASDRLCELYLGAGRTEAVLTLARRILEEDPCWERAYQHLIRAYAALGDHGQAARTYRRCVARLREEMDVAPSEETEALYRKLQAQR